MRRENEHLENQVAETDEVDSDESYCLDDTAKGLAQLDSEELVQLLSEKEYARLREKVSAINEILEDAGSGETLPVRTLEREIKNGLNYGVVFRSEKYLLLRSPHMPFCTLTVARSGDEWPNAVSRWLDTQSVELGDE